MAAHHFRDYIKDVRTEGEEVGPKANKVLKRSKGGCMGLWTKVGGGQTKFCGLP